MLYFELSLPFFELQVITSELALRTIEINFHACKRESLLLPFCLYCEDLFKKVNDGEVAFEGLSESVFGSGSYDLIHAFLEILRKRGEVVQPWMLEREREAATDRNEVAA